MRDLSAFELPCPVCAGDCSPGAPMCDVCWRRVPKAKQAPVTAAWKHAIARGFGDPVAAAAYDDAVHAAQRTARLMRMPKEERPVALVKNPEAIGDPNATPIVSLFDA